MVWDWQETRAYSFDVKRSTKSDYISIYLYIWGKKNKKKAQKKIIKQEDGSKRIGSGLFKSGLLGSGYLVGLNFRVLNGFGLDRVRVGSTQTRLIAIETAQFSHQNFFEHIYIYIYVIKLCFNWYIRRFPGFIDTGNSYWSNNIKWSIFALTWWFN